MKRNVVKNTLSPRGDRTGLGRAAANLFFSATTCHPYSTHQRVLGSGNGVLERVGKSRGSGKREGIGKGTGKSN